MKNRLSSAGASAQVIEMPVVTKNPVTLLDIADEMSRMAGELHVLGYAVSGLASVCEDERVIDDFACLVNRLAWRLDDASTQIMEIKKRSHDE